MIIPIWKTIGQSTHMLAKEVGGEEKATHTGSLDPMAEGVVIVLSGEDRFKKPEYTKLIKTYQFEVLFGVNTDSHDLLGLQSNLTQMQLNLNKTKDRLVSLLPSYTGKQKQLQPRFSSQRINGQSAFDFAKENKKINLKENTINVFSLDIIDHKEVELNILKKDILEKISHIVGDFRQKEIIKQWSETFQTLSENNIKTLPILKIEATVSKRTYIRSLIRDFSNDLNIPATTYTIIRTKNGGFTKEDCR